VTNDTGKNLLASLDALVEKYHLLKHPFYRAWTAGQLDREALALYAEQYYQHVRAFPEQLKTLAARADGELQSIVNENLAEELDPSAPHPALWRQFAAAVGAEESRLASARPLPRIAALVETYNDLAKHGTLAQAVAAFYAYEAQVPEIATQKIDGLRRFYDVKNANALAYFAVHEEADVRHRAAWRNWLAEQSCEASSGVLDAAERGLKALWGALDAVCPRACMTN
jgi:pyrroloquinoline-quinone synthase